MTHALCNLLYRQVTELLKLRRRIKNVEIFFVVDGSEQSAVCYDFIPVRRTFLWSLRLAAIVDNYLNE
jgi:hypothetical protein